MGRPDLTRENQALFVSGHLTARWLRRGWSSPRARRANGGDFLNGGRMARATWNGAVIAESDDIEVVEGNLDLRANDRR